MVKPIPYPFVLDELEGLDYRTRRMFGATAIYIGEKIVLILWEKDEYPDDSGVWLATTHEHHESLKREFPSMHSIGIFGPGPSSWQVLPANAPDFEESVYRACAMVRRGDPRIGKIPAGKKKKGVQSGNGAAASSNGAAVAPRSRRVSDEKKLPHPGRAARGAGRAKPAEAARKAKPRAKSKPAARGRKSPKRPSRH